MGSAPSAELLGIITGHFITGTIRDRSTGDPLGYEKLSLSFIGKTARCRFTTTDENGFFAFISGEYGTHEIVIQPLSQPAAGYYVELNDPFAAHEDFHMPFLLQVDTAMIDDINKAIISAQVKALYDPYLQPVKQKNASGSSNHFYGEPDKKIDLSKFIELTSLREVIKEIVPGVSTITRNDRSNFKLINKFPNQPFENPPLVLLDGVPVYDLDNLLEIRSSELEYIEVLNTRYFMADNIFDGIINIISCKGDLSILEFNRSVFRQEFKGLHTGHFPWSPDYSIDSLKKSRIPDFRNTLYWNPEMKTDKNGKANVGFFTSDESGEYTIAVEGFSHDGRSGRSEIRFIVR